VYCGLLLSTCARVSGVSWTASPKSAIWVQNRACTETRQPNLLAAANLEDSRTTAAEQDILELNVPVDYAFPLQPEQPIDNLPANGRDFETGIKQDNST